jgi:uncharacterized membrane protein YcaP (DUF421 family)
MQSWEIHINDWIRILFGNVPPEFFIEVIIRVTFIYVLIICCIRLMGKRMASQLSRNEMTAIASLAASIGIPIQTPDRGLLPALLVALIVVAAQRIVSARLSHNEKFERKSQGNISILVDDCCLQLKEMIRSQISREEVFARLRSKDILSLGQVKRLYFEANGRFSVIRHEEQQAGLCIVPTEDMPFLEEQTFSKDHYSCRNCGREKPESKDTCDHCGHKEFVLSMIRNHL